MRNINGHTALTMFAPIRSHPKKLSDVKNVNPGTDNLVRFKEYQPSFHGKWIVTMFVARYEKV
jgi:hypothetical protein